MERLGNQPRCAHTIALRKDGSVGVWGNNFAGQIGDGTRTSDGSGIDRLLPYPLEKWTIAGFYDVWNTNPYVVVYWRSEKKRSHQWQ